MEPRCGSGGSFKSSTMFRRRCDSGMISTALETRSGVPGRGSTLFTGFRRRVEVIVRAMANLARCCGCGWKWSPAACGQARRATVSQRRLQARRRRKRNSFPECLDRSEAPASSKTQVVRWERVGGSQARGSVVEMNFGFRIRSGVD